MPPWWYPCSPETGVPSGRNSETLPCLGISDFAPQPKLPTHTWCSGSMVTPHPGPLSPPPNTGDEGSPSPPRAGLPSGCSTKMKLAELGVPWNTLLAIQA
jgi:hypothetical protein